MDQNNEFPEEAVKKLGKLGWKGFEFGDNYDKMGIRSSSTAELIFNDVKVPKENLLGNDYSMRQVLRLYLEAWRVGVKTIYYVRSKALEVEDCESCSS